MAGSLPRCVANHLAYFSSIYYRHKFSLHQSSAHHAAFNNISDMRVVDELPH